jgi:hypothetical protein
MFCFLNFAKIKILSLFVLFFFLRNTFSFPRLLTHWTSCVTFQPTLQAVIMEGVIARAPSNATVYLSSHLTLTVQAEIINGLLANRTSIEFGFVVPNRDRIPGLGLHDGSFDIFAHDVVVFKRFFFCLNGFQREVENTFVLDYVFRTSC